MNKITSRLLSTGVAAIISLAVVYCPAAETSPDLSRIYQGGEPETLAELRSMEKHQRELVKKVTACTVAVIIQSAHGSGVIVSEDGLVMTAAHVVGAANRPATIIMPDGKKLRGRTLGAHRTFDAGLVKITDSGPFDFCELADASTVTKGQWCVATGHPGGFEQGRSPVVRIGRISDADRFVITTDCTLVGGDSGGPLFDMDGHVIGINSRIGQLLSANMHVPVAAYRSSWDRMMKGDVWGSLPGTGPYMGVQGDIDSKQAKITSVHPDTPAAKAGVRAGDIILKYAGKPVDDFESLQALVSDSQPGQKVKLQIRRGERVVEIQMTVGKRS